MNDLHPGDVVLNAILRRFQAVYGELESQAEQRLTAFLRHRLKALKPRQGESPNEYKERILAAFRGPAWTLAKHRIALECYQMNSRATEYINNGLEMAFEAGFNESAYVLSGEWPGALPITVGIVAILALKPQKRRMKKAKDVSYCAKRVDSAVKRAVMQGTMPGEIPRSAARIMAKNRHDEMTAAARAYIYGASDTGAYYAGLEAKKAGLDVEKTWLAIMDMRVRPSHKHLHGTTIPINDDFQSYHGPMRYPHDPNGHPAEVYRCRCRMAVHLAGKSPGEYSRKILPTQTSAYKQWRTNAIRKAGSELELAKIHRKRLGR